MPYNLTLTPLQLTDLQAALLKAEQAVTEYMENGGPFVDGYSNEAVKTIQDLRDRWLELYDVLADLKGDGNVR